MAFDPVRGAGRIAGRSPLVFTKTETLTVGSGGNTVVSSLSITEDIQVLAFNVSITFKVITNTGSIPNEIIIKRNESDLDRSGWGVTPEVIFETIGTATILTYQSDQAGSFYAGDTVSTTINSISRPGTVEYTFTTYILGVPL